MVITWQTIIMAGAALAAVPVIGGAALKARA